MLFKIFLCCLVASLTLAENITPSTDKPTVTRVESSVSFETSHKHPKSLDDDDFQTSHKISHYDAENVTSQKHSNNLSDEDFQTLHKMSPYDAENMNLLPSKEKPELDPVLSVLINEDVMKSIEAKRAIEEAELEIIKAEVDAAVQAEEKKIEESKETTEVPITVLTTATPLKGSGLHKAGDINDAFVDQRFALETAGTENNKKSRIEVKKGPNGQDYEYEYVYYYEDEDDDTMSKDSVAVDGEKAETRGKSRYTNIERSTAATPTDNSLVSGKAKGRSSNVEEDIEAERLPPNTRFPSRGKAVDVPPTPALDSTDSAAEKKKVSVKRPSLELVDSETFNTDEKQAKSSRNSDDTKSAITIEQEMASAQAAAAAAKDAEKAEAAKAKEKETESAAKDADEDVEKTTPDMEKAAFDLYALLTNENHNMEMTTDSDMDVTTILSDTTDSDNLLTTLVNEEPSSTTTTTTTTTTTPEPTTTTTSTTTTTTTTPAPSLFGGRRGAANAPGRNRFKLKSANSPSTTTTTEAPEEAPKPGKNRFSRPSTGGRNRPGARTTTAAPPAGDENQQEGEVAVKEVKTVSSGFSRNRPRNRFNIHGSTKTTEAPTQESDDAHEAAVSSTTARSFRGRHTPNIRGRSRTTTTKAPATDEEAVNDSDNSVDDKPATPAPSHSGPVRPSRFNINRAAGGRLPGRTKLSRTTTEAPATADSEDSAADSSHHNDVKGEEADAAEKTAEEPASANVGGLNRLKNRPRLGGLHKTDSQKPKVSQAPIPPRKVNPLLANRRLKIGQSTTEAAPVEEASPAPTEESESKDEAANEEAKDETTEKVETTTKEPVRGLGLLGQRRRLPSRKPGTLL